MKYRVLRDCFVDKFYSEGTIVEFPDRVKVSPRNFEALEKKENVPQDTPAESSFEADVPSDATAVETKRSLKSKVARNQEVRLQRKSNL